jgi:PAS domain S-box-containing protein
LNNDIVVMADSAGTICFWSTGAEKIFGCTREQALGQTLDLIVPPEYRQAHWRGFHSAMASGVVGAEGQAVPFPVQRRDGETTPLRGRLSLLREPEGAVVAAVVVFQNSERQSREKSRGPR